MGTKDGLIRLWEWATGKERARLVGHGGAVVALAYAPDGRLLASGCTDTTALVWDVTGSPAAELPRRELEARWADLAAEDAGKAWRAVQALAGAPRQSVAFLAAHLQPAQAADPARVAGWIKDLDAEDFGVRDRAARELEQLGERAEPALRQALAGKPSAEVRRRVQQLLERLANLSPERLRLVRAVEALEHAGTLEARQVLRTLARGAAEARLTQEAAAAVRRLDRRVGHPWE
jgi:hypothetical protein